MTTRVVRVLASGTVAALALLAACKGEQTTENDPIGEPSYDFRLVGLSRGLPRTGGSDALFLSLASFDTSVADAYKRSGDLTVRQRTAAGTWNLAPLMRRFAVDGRAPSLTGTGTPNASTLTLEGPEVAGGLWRFTLSLTGLSASTGYTVALFRYGLKTGSTATDSLDQVAVLNTGSNFTVRDSLFVLGGSGAGPSVAGGCTAATAAATSATANPLIIGTFTSSSTGTTGGAIQKCLSDAAGVYYPATQVDPSRTPIAPNSGVTFNLPQFNYLVVYNTATLVQALRGQLGQDIHYQTSAPINNAFAPMPCRVAASNCTAALVQVLSTRAKISAPGGEANVDTLRITIRGLKALGGSGVYQAWLVNPALGTAPVPALGRMITTQIDTISDVPVLDTDTLQLDSVSGTSTFVGYPMPQAAHVSYRFVVSSASAGVNLRDYTHVLFTLEPAGPATAPSARTALWFRYGDSKGTADLKDDEYFDGAVVTHPLAAVAWGRLDPTSAAAPPFVFSQAGRGFGGFRGDELSVDLNDLPRPPIGYYYQGWLEDINAGPNGTDTVYTPVDTLRGPFPDRTLLVDADSAAVDAVVVDAPPVIRVSNIRNFAGNLGLDPNRPCDPADASRGLCPFGDYENYIVTIEPKGSNPLSPSPTTVFTAAIPVVVRAGQ